MIEDSLDPWLTKAQAWEQKWRVAGAAAALDPLVSTAVALASGQGFVITHAQARGVGLSPADVRRLVRRGTWTAPRRNALCVLPRPTTEERQPHGLRPEVQASALALVMPTAVVSHESVVAMRGLPLLSDPVRPIATAREGNGGGRPECLVHLAGLWTGEIERWFGCAVTTVARTVVDVARNSGAKAGLVVADAALHDELVTVSQLVAAVERAARWPGNMTARRVVRIADARAESPLESLSRLVIIDAGLPVPDLQRWVRTASGTFRVDGAWEERMVILEADGMLKYRSDDALRHEKLRQEALERAGYLVVRVTWADVMNEPGQTAWRIA